MAIVVIQINCMVKCLQNKYIITNHTKQHSYFKPIYNTKQMRGIPIWN